MDIGMSRCSTSHRPPSMPIRAGLDNYQNASNGLSPTSPKSNWQHLHSTFGTIAQSFTSSPHRTAVLHTYAKSHVQSGAGAMSSLVLLVPRARQSVAGSM